VNRVKKRANIPDKSVGRYSYPLPLDADYAYPGWVNLGIRIANQIPIIPNDERIIKGPFLTSLSPESHTGPSLQAIDFLVPDGTEIIAGADGIIEAAVDSHSEWGPTEASAGTLNYITLRHNFNGQIEYSQYGHLEPNSFTKHGLRIGDFVKRGQVIGIVGKTGWTDRDHLHFLVFRSFWAPPGWHSLVVRFRSLGFLGLVRGLFRKN
jgi:murein DD-endopeptidase MepM/ murein hydrolase activator NlpD